MQIIGGELARDSEVKIVCPSTSVGTLSCRTGEQASYPDHLMAFLVTSEIRVYCI
jgi:hypothetical protein